MGISKENPEWASSGFGNEPLVDKYKNGEVLDEEPLTSYESLDDHYAAAERLVDLGDTSMADASKQVGYDPVLYETITPPEQTQELAKDAGIAERIVTVEERFGFTPRSRDELSYVYGLIGKDHIAGAATHLNAILNRQKQYMEDPARAVRSIVAKYAEYAKNARAEYGFLKQVEEIITDDTTMLNPGRLGTEWQYSGSIARPLVHALWAQDVASYTQDAEGVDPLKALKDGEYAVSDKRVVNRVQALIDSDDISAFEEGFNQSMNSEKNRYDFWVNALQESRRHKAASGIAYSALAELGVIKDEQNRLADAS